VPRADRFQRRRCSLPWFPLRTSQRNKQRSTNDFRCVSHR